MSFLDLPPELRQSIYVELFRSNPVHINRVGSCAGRHHQYKCLSSRMRVLEGEQSDGSAPSPPSLPHIFASLSLVCSQLYKEAKEPFYTGTTFILHLHDMSSTKLRTIMDGIPDRHMIRNAIFEHFNCSTTASPLNQLIKMHLINLKRLHIRCYDNWPGFNCFYHACREPAHPIDAAYMMHIESGERCKIDDSPYLEYYGNLMRQDFKFTLTFELSLRSQEIEKFVVLITNPARDVLILGVDPEYRYRQLQDMIQHGLGFDWSRCFMLSDAVGKPRFWAGEGPDYVRFEDFDDYKPIVECKESFGQNRPRTSGRCRYN